MTALSAVAVLLLVSVLLQALLAGILLRGTNRRRRFHGLASAVLALNAGIALVIAGARVAGQGAGADSPYHVWVRVLDFASVLLLLALALQWNRGLEQTWTRRDLSWLVPVAAVSVLHAILIVHGGTWLDSRAGRIWSLHVPTYSAYAALLLAGARRIHRGRDVRVHAPLLVAFGMRGAQFGAVDLPTALDGTLHPAGPVHVLVAWLFVLLCFAAAVVAVVGAGVAAWRRPEARSWCLNAMLLLVAGGAVGVASSQVASRAPAYEATQLLSLVLVRPLGVGFALAPGAFGNALLGTGVGVGGAWTTRLLLGLVAGGSVWRPDVWWIPSLLAGAAAAVGACHWAAARSRTPDGQDAEEARERPEPQEPSTRDVYGAHLLDGLAEAYRDGRGATVQELLHRAGIPRGSQTLAERGLAQALGMTLDDFRAATSTGNVGGMLIVRNATRPKRGRPPREYALTEEGNQRALEVLGTRPVAPVQELVHSESRSTPDAMVAREEETETTGTGAPAPSDTKR